MDLKSKLNHIRRKVMHGLIKYVSFSDTKMQRGKEIDVKRVLLCRPNSRLGNQLLITPLVQDITTLFPDCKIDLFVRGGLSELIFEKYKQVDRIIKLPKKPFCELIKYIKGWLSLRKLSYDLVVNVAESSFSGRLSTRFAHAKWRFYNNTNLALQARYPDYRHMAKSPVYNLRYYLSQSGMKVVPQEPVPSLDIKLSHAEREDAQRLLESFVDPTKKKTICIYTYATGAKCYPENWWAVMYKRLQKAFGGTYNIVEILPIEHVSQIHFQTPTYYSQNIREIASFISNTMLFFGADSGITHLAAAAGVPTVGLFSITDIAVYQPYGNHSMAIDTNTIKTKEIIAILRELLNDIE